MVFDGKALPNRYDPYQIKGKLDEFITDYFSEQKKLPVNNRYSNTKLVLGFIATLATIYAHGYEYVYNKPFPHNYQILLVCVVMYVLHSYFAFNFAYQYVDYCVCGDIYFTCNPKVGGRQQVKGLGHVKEFSVESTMAKFSPIYQTWVYVYLETECKLSPKEKWTLKRPKYFVLKLDSDVKDFFNAEGYLLEKPVSEFANRLLEAMDKS